MLVKRKRDDEHGRNTRQPPSKRIRTAGKNHLADLSDELVLKLLSLLSISDLTKAELVCQRFRRLASDNEIWREKFYTQFVRPRARRIPGLNALSKNERESQALYYASKSARWLEHNVSPRNEKEVDWKRRYKVKLNWSKGRCQAQEVALDCPHKPRILVKISNGTIYTADAKKLRSYSQRARPQILNTHYWEDGKRPTAMAIDSRGTATCLTIGFSDGSFEALDVKDDGSFGPLLDYSPSGGSAIISIATAWPHVLTMSEDHHMTLVEIRDETLSLKAPVLVLAHLRSDAPLQPVSLSIRRTSDALVASVAYSFSRLNSGWCLGLQEIRLGFSGELLDSRLTSSVDTPMQDFPLRRGPVSSRSTSAAPFALHPSFVNPPTTLSHSGCYILAGLPDNTLMVYTVISDRERLEISAGRRLFGHTSSVAGAEVSDRGKALSISAKGDEIRVWELEDLLSSWSLRKTSTQLQPRYGTDDLHAAIQNRGQGLGLAVQEVKNELISSRHWVGFDDEQVVVLGEKDQRQILSCYDFA